MTTTAKPEPAFVAGQRARKAERIIRGALHGMTAPEVTRLTSRQRREAEVIAGVRRASNETWRLVVEMLAGSSMPNALCPTCGHGDPEGVDRPMQRFGHTGPCSR